MNPRFLSSLIETLATKTISIFLVALLCSFFTGCSNNNDLPTNIGQVGESITKEQDLLDQTDIKLNQGGIPIGNNSNDSETNKINLADNIKTQELTSDIVRGWLSEYAKGSYTEISEDDGDFIRYETSMNLGGKMSIVNYLGSYYMTELKFDKNTDFVSALSAYIEAYIGRGVTQTELQEIEEDIEIAKSGGDIQFVSTMSLTASVYILSDGDNILIQIV